MSNLKYMSVSQIQAILNENYTRGKNGHDYEESKAELEQLLWDKQQKEDEELFERMENEYISKRAA